MLLDSIQTSESPGVSCVTALQEISDGLRYALQTDSKYTLMVSGTGHAGMEAAIANLLEPGEKIIVGNAGIWGERVADLSARYGGKLLCLQLDCVLSTPQCCSGCQDQQYACSRLSAC